MELLLFRPVEFQLHYNCTGFDVEAIPLDTRRKFTHSSVHIVLCAIYYLLYIPCLWSIWRNRLHSCYKMLLYLGCVDCSTLWVVGLLRGYLGMTGAVYCSSPIFQYVVGSFAMSCLFAHVVAQFILSINRCMALLAPKWETALFAGNRTWLWMLLPTVYGTAWFFFGNALVFDGVRFSWVMNPYVSWNIFTTYYSSKWYSLHILYANICLASVYAIFFIAFRVKIGTYHLSSATTENINARQRMVFVQVFLITVFNVSAGLLQIVFPNSTSHQAFTSAFDSFIEYLVIYSWLQIHGFPPVIFLTLNQTIRKDAITFCRLLSGKSTNNSVSVANLAILMRTPPGPGAVSSSNVQQQQTFGIGTRTARIAPANVAVANLPADILSGSRRRSMRFRV